MKPNYLLESSDEYLISLKIDEIIKKEGFSSAVKNEYDMEEVEFSSALEDIDTYGLFSDKKVIIISHIEALPSSEHEKEIDHFFQYLKNPLDTTLVIVTARKLNNTKKMVKQLKKELEFIPLSMNALEFAKKELDGYRLENGVLKKLVSDCLEDIGRIHQECVKLKIYREDEKTISLDDVSLMVVKKLGDSRDLTFEFVRVLASKDKKKALEMYHELEKYSIEAIPLIGLLASQFLIMYQVKILEKKTRLNQEIADILGEKPYRIQKTRELTRYYSDSELRHILRELADMDLKIKSTDVDGSFLVELFILKHC